MFPLAGGEAPLHDATGQVIGLFGISREITNLKQAEEARTLGIREVLMKPVTLQKLAESIRRALDGSPP